MEKIIKLAKKLHKNNENKSPSDFFRKLTRTSEYKLVYEILNPEEIILLCLLISNYKKDGNIDELYKEIKYNLFVFSVVEITSDEVEEVCRNCGDSGEIICDICGGEGEVLDDDENYIDCESCVNGYTLCDECNGLGYIINEDHNGIDQYYFVSFDSKIKTHLEYSDTFSKMSDDFFSNIMRSKKTVLIGLPSGTSDSFYGDFEVGDKVFTGINDFGEFYKSPNWLQPLNLKGYV